MTIYCNPLQCLFVKQKKCSWGGSGPTRHSPLLNLTITMIMYEIWWDLVGRLDQCTRVSYFKTNEILYQHAEFTFHNFNRTKGTIINEWFKIQVARVVTQSWVSCLDDRTHRASALKRGRHRRSRSSSRQFFKSVSRFPISTHCPAMTYIEIGFKIKNFPKRGRTEEVGFAKCGGYC